MSWLYSQALVAAYSEAASLDGVPSAPLNSTPMPQAFLSPDRMTAFSRPSRFGMTFAPLTDDLGEAVLTWCLEASLARTSPTLAPEPDSQALARDSGPRWRASFATWNHATSSWRTSQLSHAEDSTSFSGTWPRWGSMLDGACSELVTPVLPIAENASGSLLPTPTASSYGTTNNGRRGDGSTFATAGTPSLATMARKNLWPTPTAGDAKSSGSRNTPMSKAHGGLSLTDAVRMDGGVGRTGPSGGPLNPTWVEWLMGWPLGWTALEPLAMDRFQQWLRLHGQ